jgi:hypothetical protein
MKITYLTDEPTIAKTLIGGVLGAPHFSVVINSNSVRVSSKEFWFDLIKEHDAVRLGSTHFPPLVVKSYLSIQRLKHCVETELHLYLKRYYTLDIKEEDGTLTVFATKK